MSRVAAAIDISHEIKSVERAILAKFETRSMLLDAASRYLITGGGKRMRAALVLLAARLGNKQDLDGAINVAAAIEMIHSASLAHDDLVDDAEVRRGRTTVHSKWNGSVALMVGDYLFALASGQMAEADRRIIKSFARGVERICEAELSPVTTLEPIEESLQQYYHKIGGKTAALFECAAEAGMIVGGGSGKQIEALRLFGYEVGVAFQIVDDVLDFTSDEQTLGKPAGHDLSENTITLPVIYAIHMGAGPAVREAVETLEPSRELVAAAVAEVRRICATKRAMGEAERLIQQAVDRLDIFPDSPAKDALIDLAERTVSRTM